MSKNSPNISFCSVWKTQWHSKFKSSNRWRIREAIWFYVTFEWSAMSRSLFISLSVSHFSFIIKAMIIFTDPQSSIIKPNEKARKKKLWLILRDIFLLGVLKKRNCVRTFLSLSSTKIEKKTMIPHSIALALNFNIECFYRLNKLAALTSRTQINSLDTWYARFVVYNYSELTTKSFSLVENIFSRTQIRIGFNYTIISSDI